MEIRMIFTLRNYWLKGEPETFLGGGTILYIYIALVVTQVHTYLQIYPFVHLKFTYFTKYKLYLSNYF